LVGAYVALLLVSTIFRHLHSRSGVPEGMRVASLRTIDQGRVAPGQIRLAFIDTSPEARSMPVILVHGSPGTSRVFGSVTPALAPSFRVIVPDLPGFGASTHELPDYSFRAHAQYILELLDELRIRKAQLVGFSMGGGVVLSMADIAPERVASIVLLSAIGVQEQELLGSYWGNHVLHGAQLGALWLLREGAPHFGVLDQFALDVKYARNFYDSDQRPLRSILQRYKGPMLILHGNGDPLRPCCRCVGASSVGTAEPA
jgi:Predicted hydrolases or acyltransferases (alpha/beta hydrolase superfamily)